MCAKYRLSAEVRKKEICEVARKVFLRKGFQNTTMEDVINAVGMSKGGVYYHYQNTSDMLYDIMSLGNEVRFEKVEDFIYKNSDKSKEEIAIELVVLKIFDKNEYKSIYAMLLIEAEKNEKLKELKERIEEDSKKAFLDFVKETDLENLSCLVNDDFMQLINSMIIAGEILDISDMFLRQSNLFREIISSYLKKNSENNILE